MNRINKFAMVVYLLPTVGFLLQGTVYLTTSKFMPYQAAALSADWHELSLPYQGFVIGVIRGMGAGSFSVALALLIILLIPYRRRETWTYWAVPLIGVSFSSLTAYAAFTIDTRTPASTPWPATCGLALIYFIGGVLTLIPRLRQKESLP